jgi:hypothetical protein
MKLKSIINAVVFLIGTSTCTHAVMHPSHYKKLAEESKIKAIAIVEAVRLIDNGKRFSIQEAVFRPARAFAENVPERFSGSCYSVLHKWQNPGVGGKIYFYPKKGERVFVTVSRDGGSITSYTRLTPRLEAALKKDPESVVFGMGEALVIEGEREKKISETWYLYKIDQQPVGYLHAVAKELLHRRSPLLFEHRFVIRDAGRVNEIKINTYCMKDNYLTPQRMIIEWPDRSRVDVGFTQQPTDTVQSGIFRPDPKKDDPVMAIPDYTVTDLLLFEIVKRLAFENETFSYHLLESAELHLKKNKKLKAMGKDPNRNNLYRYVETTDHSASYWVDKDRNLTRVVWDNDKEFIKTDKATATSGFPY